jgi:ubiquinone/menaquinone biosynthesis C-methylase UbiE
MGRAIGLSIASCLAVGAISTLYWFLAADAIHTGHAAVLVRALPTLGLCTLLTLAHLLVRWLRWQFVVRRFTRSVKASDSFLVYFCTLPALLVPLYLGELVRVAVLTRRYRTARLPLVGAWVIEKLADAVTLGLLIILARSGTAGLIASAGAAVLFPVIARRWSGRATWKLWELASIGSFAMAAWLLLAWAFVLMAGRFAPALEAPAKIGVFAASTLLGGVTGVPLGIGITGSSMIGGLMENGVPRAAAVPAVALFRLGTAWFAVVLGIGAALWKRRELAAFFRAAPASDHFDEIADEYDRIIPDHVRARLLDRKTGKTLLGLSRHGVAAGARGLDVGCGQGWYLAELARLGYDMYGVDLSENQVARAVAHLRAERVSAEVRHANAGVLPYPNAFFDFVYSINTVHHITDAATRSRALAEMVRVLKPGGALILHEINIENPLFRLYMGYVFPLLRRIDDGTELWVRPTALPAIAGGRWDLDIDFFTFFPEFVPAAVLTRYARAEAALEQSRWRRYSAHYMAVFTKD